MTFPDDAALRSGIVDASYFTKHIDNIDHGREWRHIGHRAKSFVKSCLATEEGKRLSAAECLDLPWFQHPYYKREFDALYLRTIADWKPRVQDQDFVQTIDTSDLDEKTEDHSHTRSRFFAKSQSQQDSALARFRPNELCASPVQVPETPPRASDVQPEESQFLDLSAWPHPPRTTQNTDDLDPNLTIASQNLARNSVMNGNHRALPITLSKRKAIYR